MYTLRLLGGLTLDGPSGRLSGRIAQPRQLALLTLLAATPGAGGCSRARLVGFLWPETDEERARHLLSDALYVVHKELGDGAVLVSGQDLWLNRDVVSVDVITYQESLEADDPESAVACYAGAFLDGFHVGAMPEFERWVDAERQRHARSYAGALEALALRAEEEGHPRDAVDWWRRLVAHDPYSSRVTLRLMEALVRVGDHVAALEVARTHERLLGDDLDLEPAPEVAALAGRLREEPPSVPPAVPGDGVPAARQGEDSSGREVPAPLSLEGPSPGSPEGARPLAPEAPAQVSLATTRAVGAAAAAAARKAYGLLPWRRGRWDVIAAVGAVVVGAAAVVVLLLERDNAVLDPDRIVVDVLSNQTGDPTLDPLGAMAGHWLVQSLHASGLRVVPFDVSLATVQRASTASAARPERLETLARTSGARIVVSGSYYLDGGDVRFQAEVSDAARGEVLFAPAPVRAPLDSPSLAFRPLRADVRAFLFRYLNPAAVLDTLPGWIPPPDFEAYRRFLVGMDYFLASDWAAAVPHFREAARLDTVYPPFLYMTAIALTNEGEYQEAETYLAKLDGLDERMTPYDRATVDMLEARSPADKLRAARRMAEVGPSYVGIFIVAWDELQLNRPAEALKTLDQPGVGDMLAPDWAPYWQVRIQALHSLGRHEEELEAARRGRELHPDAPLLLGSDLEALAALGRSREVLEGCDELFRMGPAGVQALIRVGDELDAHGDSASATAVWARLVDALREEVEVGSGGPGSGSRIAALVGVLERLGRNAQARSLLDSLAGTDSLAYMEHLGVLAARRGDRDEAESALSWLAAYPDDANEELEARHLRAEARIAAEVGDTERALELLRRALAVGGGYWSVHRDHGLRPLRDHRGFLQLIRPAH